MNVPSEALLYSFVCFFFLQGNIGFAAQIQLHPQTDTHIFHYFTASQPISLITYAYNLILMFLINQVFLFYFSHVKLIPCTCLLSCIHDGLRNGPTGHRPKWFTVVICLFGKSQTCVYRYIYCRYELDPNISSLGCHLIQLVA